MNDIVTAIERALPKERPIHHHEPYIDGKEVDYVTRALKGGIADNHLVRRLEAELSQQCGTSQAVCTSSGTAALHVTLLAAGVQPDEEVLVPALTFAGTAHAISYCKAVPNFIDGALGVSAFKLRRYLERNTGKAPNRRGRLNSKTGRVITALIVVDLLGFPADWPKLTEVADEFGLTLIEDAAQALGASLGNRKCGSFGRVAILSFNNNKIVTGNGGGAVLTNDEWIAAKAAQLATTARVYHPYLIEHDALGFNYRMGNVCASLVLAQLSQLGDFLTAKKALLERYEAALKDHPSVLVLKSTKSWHGEPNYWLTTILVDNRDQLLEALHARGILARALSTPLNRLPYYKDCPQDSLDYAGHTFKSAVCLPSGVGL